MLVLSIMSIKFDSEQSKLTTVLMNMLIKNKIKIKQK